ncbi:helix-turn-helix transcriptional regulator [Lentibacillus amyloliquefaciens]|uniref:Transcriptional regulator n=1 Tax=Lentibacillus amyloliquefaciens TaxID=1472767 RepID=A0A0U3WKN2_9BACI|nr:helix-turn-helix domain-containing protein [Lentibacillus amyloliquefaciens]ALX50431.1 transcriptional regulator [Lentibacillus amyloliquefaciens]
MTKNINLYIARREHDIYQKDIANKLGIHPQTYHEKERGKKDFTLTEARMLAQIFECTLNDLFQEEKTNLKVVD